MSYAPKKQFGQHFLRDNTIALRICDSLQGMGKEYDALFEIGPGQGVLTQTLYERYGKALHLVEIDEDLIPDLEKKYPLIKNNVIQQDVLEVDFTRYAPGQFGIIGNFPYNISSQIIFKVIENRAHIPEMVGMFQREVAQRVASPPGNKVYGLLSVWLQAFYEVKYLFMVNEGSFFPPPKVKSGVIRLVRRENFQLDCNEKFLLQVIKQAFNQRRKTLRNSLKQFVQNHPEIDSRLLDKRPEQLGYEEFIYLAKTLETTTDLGALEKLI